MARPQLEPGTRGKVSLRKRGNTWQARASARTLGGAPLDLSGKGATPEEATEDLDRSLRELTVFAGAPLSENSTIAMAIDSWLAGRRAAVSAGTLKPQSYEKYVSTSVAVKARLGAVKLHQARAGLILPYLEQLVIEEGAARGRAFRMVLKGAIDTAISREAMGHDPLAKAPAYRSGKRVQPSITNEQFASRIGGNGVPPGERAVPGRGDTDPVGVMTVRVGASAWRASRWFSEGRGDRGLATCLRARRSAPAADRLSGGDVCGPGSANDPLGRLATLI